MPRTRPSHPQSRRWSGLSSTVAARSLAGAGEAGDSGRVLERLRPLRDLIWPAACICCGAPGHTVCIPCALDIDARGDPRWHLPDPCPTSFPPTATWGDYDGALRRLVVAHKDEDRTDAAPLLAALLSRVIEITLDGLDRPVLVPIPSSRRSTRHRGRQPLLDVLTHCRLGRELPVVQALTQRRRVVDQARLDHRARRVNLQGAIEVRAGWAESLVGTDVVLIDDVVTTGATLAEATRAIIESGADGEVRSLCAATICATQRHDEADVTPDLPQPRVVD